MHKITRNKVAIASILVSLGITGAQQASARTLQAAIVTAQTRTETLSDTPMTISVVNTEQIGEFGVFTLEDINNLTTGLAISGSGVDFDFAVRGLGSDLNSPLVPRITFYVDGNYFAQPRGLLTGLFDLAQMEVLRGPQGTLYGQTSPAGAITIQSNNPNLQEIDGYARQSFTEHEGSNTQLAVSLPIIENQLGLRISGLYDTNENTDIQNITLDRDLQNETTAYRAVLLWEPADNFSLRMSYWDIEDDNDIDPMVEGNGLDVDDRAAVADFASSFKNETDMIALEANYVFSNDWAMTFVASDQNQRIIRDFDEDSSEVLGINVSLDSDVDDIQTGGWRLASQGNDFWDWTAGVFYFETSSVTEVFVDAYQAVSPGLSVFADIENPAFLDSETWAVFTHNTLHLTEKGSVTLGLRYTESERDGRQPFDGDFFRIEPDGSLSSLGGDQFEGIPPELQNDTSDAVTGTLKYQYRFTDDLMGYASYDRGWTAANVNVARTPVPQEFLAFDEETSDNLEIGFKWQLLEGRGLWNMALYYQIYNDFHYNAEQTSFRGVRGTVELESPVVNVDEAETYGFDTDFTVLLSDNWSLRAGLSYNKAELTDATNIPCTNGAPIGGETFSFNTCDLAGERAGAQPEWSANASSEYHHGIGNDMQWYVRGLLNAESEYYSLSRGTDLDSYTTLDAYLGLRSASGIWDANFWVKNITDESAVLKSEIRQDIPDFDAGMMVENPYVWIRRSLDPRTIGVTLNYKF